MSIWVEIKNDEAYYYLRSLMRRAVERAEREPMPADVAEHSKLLHDALVAATQDPKAPEQPQEKVPDPPKKARKPRTPTAKAAPSLKPNYCQEHPNYGAKRKPRGECETCWKAYARFNPLSPHLRKRKA